ncbi:hypothetical protein BDV95DRAFT_573693 [Massariosphaeria phaeospora]|uniref:Uncharacterized protein n=1 Tax=Massariosphaeria phaeospora TaxID=100035 RepID=A0A7C8I950_9PLEO|nr:hypothetical protein BDV95DRAFT_573693 [Massariosphaeria phaeospora]
MFLGLFGVLSDVLHRKFFHPVDPHGSPSTDVVSSMEPILEITEKLIEEGAAHEKAVAHHHPGIISSILEFWRMNQILTDREWYLMKQAQKKGRDRAESTRETGAIPWPQSKSKYTLPNYSGVDDRLLWYELPASTMLDPMIKNHVKPIFPNALRREPFKTDYAGDDVSEALDDYFEDLDLEWTPTADNPTGETASHRLWIDSMGHLHKRNKQTGEVKSMGNGYGWSLDFCKQMKLFDIPKNIIAARMAYMKENMNVQVKRKEDIKEQDARQAFVRPQQRRRNRSASPEQYDNRPDSRESASSRNDASGDSKGHRRRSKSSKQHQPVPNRGRQSGTMIPSASRMTVGYDPQAQLPPPSIGGPPPPPLQANYNYGAAFSQANAMYGGQSNTADIGSQFSGNGQYGNNPHYNNNVTYGDQYQGVGGVPYGGGYGGQYQSVGGVGGVYGGDFGGTQSASYTGPYDGGSVNQHPGGVFQGGGFGGQHGDGFGSTQYGDYSGQYGGGVPNQNRGGRGNQNPGGPGYQNRGGPGNQNRGPGYQNRGGTFQGGMGSAQGHGGYQNNFRGGRRGNGGGRW